jgi:hypothetical protein
LVAVGDDISMDDEKYYPEKSIPDLKLSEEQRERIAQLTQAEVARIDNWLLSFAGRRERKVLYLTLSAISELKSDIEDVPSEFYIFRVQRLIEEGRLVVFTGEIETWLDCEVRLAPGDIEWK